MRTLEQSVQDTLSLSQDSNQLDAFFQSIPPNLLLPQRSSHLQSEQDSDPRSQLSFDHRFNEVVSGLRIVCVDETQLQLQSFFDYVVGINDDPIPLISNQHGYFYPDYNQITQIFNTTCNSYLKLNVWSAKGGSFRDEYINVYPKDETKLEDISLSSMKDSEYCFQSLGFKVQWTSLVASTFTYHVLNINLPDGPAALSGLIPDEDYIIGCQDGLLATGGETLLQDIVRSRANHDLIIYVYNKVHDCVRPLTVHIGGDGRLGCNVGSGFLHRIPAVITNQLPPDQNPVQHAQDAQPDRTLYSPSPLNLPPSSTTTFVPGNIIASVAPIAASSPPKKHGLRKKHIESSSAKPVMDDYFNEGKDKSARNPPLSKENAATELPPPPLSATHKKHTDEE